MEQITAKEKVIQMLKDESIECEYDDGTRSLCLNEINFDNVATEIVASLRSVSETKPDEDSFQQYLLELGIGAKERDLIITKYGVPVSEVGQMEAIEILKDFLLCNKSKDVTEYIQKLSDKKVYSRAKELIEKDEKAKRCKCNSLTSESDGKYYCSNCNTLLHDSNLSLPVPNTKTVEGELSKDVVLKFDKGGELKEFLSDEILESSSAYFYKWIKENPDLQSPITQNPILGLAVFATAIKWYNKSILKRLSSLRSNEPEGKGKERLEVVLDKEVGQMEEKDIQKLAFERYPVNEQGLVSGWEDINKDLREGFIEGLKMLLPVPNTKTKWDRLNSELDTALANMTDEDWDKIKNKRSKKELPNTKTVQHNWDEIIEHWNRKHGNHADANFSDFFGWLKFNYPTKTVEGEVQINFGGHVLTTIRFTNGELEVVGAMNGWGNGISKDQIEIKHLTPLRSNEPEREGKVEFVEYLRNKFQEQANIHMDKTEIGSIEETICNAKMEAYSDALNEYKKHSQLSPPLKALSEENKITRVEVIDYLNKKGRVFVHWDKNSKVELSHQDNGRTLKIFIDAPVPEVKEKGDGHE